MDYSLRGKCKEMSEAAVAADPTLRLVRGHYWCPIWNTDEEHWWCVREDGTIVDPTAAQFPSAGMGHYVEFDGMCSCENCGEPVHEDDAIPMGRFAVCSDACALRLVGC